MSLGISVPVRSDGNHDADPAGLRRCGQRCPEGNEGQRRRVPPGQLGLGPGRHGRCVCRRQIRRPPEPGRDRWASLSSGAKEFVPGVPVDVASTFTYFGGGMLGAFIGAVVCWLAYKQHFDAEPDAANKLGVFSTGPAIRNYGWNVVTEIIGTFVLVFVDPACFGNGAPPALARCPLPCWLSASAPPSVDPPATPSTPPVTLARASPTPCCPSRARAPATGATPGCRLLAR